MGPRSFTRKSWIPGCSTCGSEVKPHCGSTDESLSCLPGLADLLTTQESTSSTRSSSRRKTEKPGRDGCQAADTRVTTAMLSERFTVSAGRSLASAMRATRPVRRKSECDSTVSIPSSSARQSGRLPMRSKSDAISSRKRSHPTGRCYRAEFCQSLDTESCEPSSRQR